MAKVQRCPACQRPVLSRNTLAPERVCAMCRQMKPAAAYAGVDAYCRPCRQAYSRRYRGKG